jgi:RNA-directed DNA polymerase
MCDWDSAGRSRAGKRETSHGACLRNPPSTIALKRTDADIRTRFKSLYSAYDVADILEVTTPKLTYYAYKNRAYKTFDIPKRRGGTRKISAPANNLRILQMKLNHVLRLVYRAHVAVHGFALGRSIVSNAASHAKRRYVLNVDLRDFFGSINFGRVRGMLMARPYSLGPGAATIIAQLCTFNGVLPQGAPSSPIITNMICGRLDSDLKKLAASHRCRYTRYADDITISASTRLFPEALARLDSSSGTKRTVIGDALLDTLQKNGFEVNPDKVRLLLQGERQEVTGLVANRFPNVPRSYVRHLRGLLHAWERYGADAAANEFFANHDHKGRGGAGAGLLRKVVRGKIEFVGRVRGKDDPIYLKLLIAFAKLNPSLGIKIPEDVDIGHPGMKDDLLPLLRKRMFMKDLLLVSEKATPAAPVSLLMIDLDHFKTVNDKHGHPVGDEVLVGCASVIAARCQGKGEAYRYGGDEIAVLLPNFTTSEAAVLAELIRSDIEKTPLGSKQLSITVSIGLATSPGHAADPKALLAAADKALYEAKAQGRNRVAPAGGHPRATDKTVLLCDSRVPHVSRPLRNVGGISQTLALPHFGNFHPSRPSNSRFRKTLSKPLTFGG